MTRGRWTLSITVDSNYRELVEVLREPKPVIAKELLWGMDQSTQYLQREVMLNIVEVDAIDQGGFLRSIERKVDPYISEVYSNRDYAEPIEYGRPPGSMPPRDPIIQWMMRKGIPLEAEWPIRMKIKREGIKARPVFQPAFERGKRDVERYFVIAGQRITLRLFGRVG